MDVEELIRRPELGMRVVGMILDDLVWPSPDVKARRTMYPPVGSLRVAEDITAPFTWNGEEVN